MILSDDEINTMADEYLENYRIAAGCALNFGRDVEQAVLAKLSAGVSVEPVIRGWMNPANGIVIDPQKKKQIGVGDGYPNFSVPLYDESGTVTSKQLQTAIASARVQALEEAAKVCESEYDNWDNERPLRICAGAIRALIGKEST